MVPQPLRLAAPVADQMKLIVCERTGRWASWLRPMVPSTCRLQETRNLSDAWQAFLEARTGILALEATVENILPVLETIRDVRSLGSTCVVTLTSRTLAKYRWVMRELGADYVACSPADLTDVVKLVQRHAFAMPAPAPQLTFTENLRQCLPWGR